MASRVGKLPQVVTFVLRIILRRQKTVLGTFGICLLGVLAFLWRQLEKSRRRLPPGPWGLPVVGILPHLIAVDNPGRKIKNMSQIYGPILYTKIGSYWAVFLNDSELIEESICQREKLFHMEEGYRHIFEDVTFSFDLPKCGLSAKNQSERRLVYKVLHNLASENTIQDIENKINRWCIEMINKIEIHAENETPVNPLTMLMGSMPNLYLSIIFNTNFDREDVDYKLFLKHFCHFDGSNSRNCVTHQANLLLPFVNNMPGNGSKYWKDLVACMENKLNMERDEISNAVEDFLTGIEKEDRNSLDSRFTMNLLFVFALTYIGEGSLSIAVSLCWLLLYMVKYPHIQNNVQSELDGIINRGRSPHFADFSELPYLAAVIQESLRHSPSAYMSLQYQTEAEVPLRGYSVPQGTYVFHNLWSILHDSKQYPLPHKFNPDRFLRDHRRLFVKDDRIRFLQFGSNATKVPSVTENMRTLLFSNILHCFSLTSDIRTDDISLDGENGLIRYPQDYRIIFCKRDVLQNYQQ